MTRALSEFVALIGIDWADQKHDVWLQDNDSGRSEHLEIQHSSEAIDEWVSTLREQFGGRPIAICLEQKKGALIHCLQKYDFLVIYPVPPARLAKYREAVASQESKDDVTDAWLILDFLRKHSECLRELKPDNPIARELSMVAETRRSLVNQRTALTNRLKATLKQYYPQALELVGDSVYSRLACAFLLRWLTPDAVKNATPDQLRKFYYGHNSRNSHHIEKRIQLAQSLIPLTTDPAIVKAMSLLVKALVGQLRVLGQSIREFDKRQKELLDQHPDKDIFSSFPGAGEALQPRLAAAFGIDRDRFQSAEEVQRFSGIAPAKRKSGNGLTVRRRMGRPVFVLQTFHEYARCSLKTCGWAKAYFDSMRKKGSGYHAALRALAFKWIRIMFRCWKSRMPYNEEHYLATLKHRGSPLALDQAGQ